MEIGKCDILARDTAGRTALHFAALAGNLEAAQYLVNHGLSLHVEDYAGKTAEDLSRDEGFYQLEVWLKERAISELQTQ